MRFKAQWLFLLVLGITVAVLAAAQAPQARGGLGGSQITAAAAQPEGQPGTRVTLNPIKQWASPTLLDRPPELSAARRAARDAEMQRRAALRRTRPIGEQVPATEPPDRALDNAPDPAAPPPAPAGPGNPFVIEVSSALDPTGNGFGSANVGEPTVAQSGGFVFYTGNWYAAEAFTANPGPADWLYIDPYADDPNFCCDQDVVTDQARDMFLWTRLVGNNYTLSISNDHFSTYCTYYLTPGQLGFGGSFDQPLMALSNNYVYISASIFGPFHNVLTRLPLDQLQDCGSVNFNFWDITDANGWGGLTQGATTTMYLGSHRGFNNTMRIFTQPENTTSIFRNDVAITAFTFQNGNSNCPRNGTNPCLRSDSRIQTGWVRKGSNQTVGEIGFMWDAHEGGGFPWAYVEAATFRQDTLAYTTRPFIAYSNGAVQYPAASPNARGDVGLTLTIMGGDYDPDPLFYLADDYQGMWTFEAFLAVSDSSVTNWGDYVRNQPFLPCGGGWTSAGHALQGGNFVPYLSIVSRQRDKACILRQLTTP
jgi:hypothetical protein